jgi:hypothetical protein
MMMMAAEKSSTKHFCDLSSKLQKADLKTLKTNGLCYKTFHGCNKLECFSLSVIAAHSLTK